VGTPLEKYHSFGLRVQAQTLLLPTSEHRISELVERSRYFIGEGTNILPLGDLPTVLSTRYLKGYEVIQSSSSEVEVEVAAGENWDSFVRFALSQGWYGLENLAAIPGNVGGAAVQNIGAYGVELAPFVDSVYGWDRLESSWKRLPVEACEYGYRYSLFQSEGWRDRFFITRVRLRLARQFRPVLTYPDVEAALAGKSTNDPWQVYQVIRAIRLRKLPSKGSAGSFFKNPILPESDASRLQALAPDLPLRPIGEGLYKAPAAWLIDRAGLKGFRWGGAMVHPHQALVLVNAYHATPMDIQQLATYIQAKVAEQWGVQLEPEVRYLHP